MPDMIVKLYELAANPTYSEEMQKIGVTIRRPIAPEASIVRAWVTEQFGIGWADECTAAFANRPATLFLAVEAAAVVGFSCYEATCKAFFGPTGVAESHRGRGIGTALLLAALYGLRDLGYAYGIIGGAGPTEFYRNAAGAISIEGSSPGIYAGMLRPSGAQRKN